MIKNINIERKKKKKNTENYLKKKKYKERIWSKQIF